MQVKTHTTVETTITFDAGNYDLTLRAGDRGEGVSLHLEQLGELVTVPIAEFDQFIIALQQWKTTYDATR